jgi:hypothetical protein
MTIDPERQAVIAPKTLHDVLVDGVRAGESGLEGQCVLGRTVAPPAPPPCADMPLTRSAKRFPDMTSAPRMSPAGA